MTANVDGRKRYIVGGRAPRFNGPNSSDELQKGWAVE
jgi:hypothetical protein